MKLGKVAELGLILVLLLGILIAVPPRSFAADDSNSGSLTQSQTVNPQALSSTIQELTQGLNNTQVQQLTNQLQSELNSGDTSGSATTLTQLQNLLKTQSGSEGVPDSLSSLLQSLTAGPNGITLNSSELSNLLGLDGPNGLPTNMSNQNATSSAAALQALSSLLKNVNPPLSQQLLGEADGIIQNNSTSPGLTTPTLPQGHPNLPSINPPSLNAAPVGKLPSISAAAIAIPTIVVAAAIAVFSFRNRFASAIGRQILPGQVKPVDLTEAKYDPSDPRSRILYAFSRAVKSMRGKGFEKFTFESHREFEKKCATSLESPHVSALSSLYEKAMFSGRKVSVADADQATRELSLIEAQRN